MGAGCQYREHDFVYDPTRWLSYRLTTNLIALYHFLKGGSGGGGADFLSLVTSDRA